MLLAARIQIALAIYTIGVERSRRPYRAEPFAGTRDLNKTDQAEKEKPS